MERRRGEGGGTFALASDDVDGDQPRTVASPMPMGSHARQGSRLAAGLALTASLFGGGAARAQGMDPTPERLVLQPNLPDGTPIASTTLGSCQNAAADPGAAFALAAKHTAPGAPVSISGLACRPDNVAFKNLVSELGFALAPSTMHPARTVGFGGFVLSLEAAYTHINADEAAHSGGSTAQYWHLGTRGSADANGVYSTQDNSPDSLIGVYSLMVRKGLPFGFELDGALAYVQNTSLWTVGADVRWALLEGFRTGPFGYIPDLAVGAGVRTMTGSSKLYMTTLGIDGELSKPITLADEAVLTPYLGFQHLIIYGNSAVLDSTPNVNAIQQCGYTGRDPNKGTPTCKNNIPGTTVPNDNDFNNNITFAAVQLNRERVFVGLTYRYEILYLGGQFLMDVVPPNNIDADLSSSLQWTVSLQAGVFF